LHHHADTTGTHLKHTPQPSRETRGHELTDTGVVGHDETVPSPPESTKNSLRLRLADHARGRWPQLRGVQTRFRASFAYIDATLPDGTTTPLMRLRYGGSAHRWGFAIYLASNGKYEDSILPDGTFTGSPEQALDTACGLYLADPTAWLPPTN
jgi:hypothetical protein